MKLKDYPSEIIEMVILRHREQDGNTPRKHLLNYSIMSALDWISSPEGSGFWDKVHNGDLNVFYEKYPIRSQTEYKGDLKGFPAAIVNAMLDEQVKQGNTRDVTMFEKDIIRDDNHGGFDWSFAKESKLFWSRIINHKEFNIFFDKYPHLKDTQTTNNEKSNESNINDKRAATNSKQRGTRSASIIRSSRRRQSTIGCRPYGNTPCGKISRQTSVRAKISGRVISL